MDPYIDAERLDRRHPLTARKLANLRLADRAHAERAEEVVARPAKVTLQTNDLCNLACPHCQIPPPEKRARMDRRVLDRVIEELFPTLIELHPTNLGEPLLWPHFEDLCSALKRFGVLLDLTTNGLLLDEARLGWITPVARVVRVSFDGATASTFERLRSGARFDRVCENTRRLCAATRPGTVALQMTLMRSNYQELAALVRLAADLGANAVNAYHLFSFRPEWDEESIVGEPELWPPVLDHALSEAARCGVTLRCAEPAGHVGDVRPTACHLPWHQAWVDYDGEVLPCHSHGGDSAGNLLREPFMALWNGALYRRIRAGHARSCPTWRCDGCGMNFEKRSEHAPVPYDVEAFVSPEGRRGLPLSPVRWSGRMRPFELVGRRHGR
ncbi:MAG: radical SAM protein [Polyangiaceae bacterium]|nr:radical SAM protein [Polyangiaceae bacterium]